MQLAYQKCRYKENPEIKMAYLKKRYQQNQRKYYKEDFQRKCYKTNLILK